MKEGTEAEVEVVMEAGNMDVDVVYAILMN